MQPRMASPTQKCFATTTTTSAIATPRSAIAATAVNRLALMGIEYHRSAGDAARLKDGPRSADLSPKVNAPLRNRVQCVLFGHDWRQAIDPREGFYERCRRCWRARQAEPIAARPVPAREPERRAVGAD